MPRYWETEKPVKATTHKNVLEYYPKAGQLSVARAPWKDTDGTEKMGKTVVFNIAALLECDTETMMDARDIFKAIYDAIDAELHT